MKLQTIWQGGVPAFVRQTHAEVQRSEAEKERKRRALEARKAASRRRAWSPKENAIMRERYPEEGASQRLQEELGRDARSIRAQAQHLGLRLSRKALSRINAATAARRREAQEAEA